MRRIIQVGLGNMGSVWADQVARSQRWTAAAYVDTDRRRLLSAATRHGMPKTRCYTDLEKALREVEADAVLDATPQQARKKVCRAAFERGLHVLSEKPLADTVRSAKALVNRAERMGVTYMVAQNYRYQAVVQTARRFVAAGRLGSVGYAGVAFHKGPRFGGFREEMAYPLVLDMAIHHLDLMRCVLGADIRWVQVASIGAPWNWNKGDATVMAQVAMDSGAFVNYFGSWVATGWETPWNGDWRIEGSDGVLLWENDALTVSNSPGHRRKVRMIKWPKSHQAYLLDAFAACLDNGSEPETSGRNNLNSLAATFAMVRSAREKRRVPISEMLG